MDIRDVISPYRTSSFFLLRRNNQAIPKYKNRKNEQLSQSLITARTI